MHIVWYSVNKENHKIIWYTINVHRQKTEHQLQNNVHLLGVGFWWEGEMIQNSLQ